MLAGRLLSWFKTPPRIPEIVLASVLVWLFASGDGWTVLLADGDTGWHIRNGEQIIDTRTVPHRDAFSFGSADHPWYAWEWLADVVFAILFRRGGLQAVAIFCGIVIAASVSVLLRHIFWRSVGVSIALPLTFLAVGASSVHYLARPHVIGLLFFALTAWMIDVERASPGRRIWVLPPLFALWANCHGSFLAGLAMIGLFFLETIVRHRRVLSRPAAVLAVSAAATLSNPYGWLLHAHALEYLRSSWIQATIEEFQSPRFRSENMLQYELVLIVGLMALPWLWRRKELYPGGVILLWAHESLASVRHVPLYCVAACPFIASWLQSVWDQQLRRRSADSILTALDAVNLTWKPWTRGFTAWPLVLFAVIVIMARQEPGGRPVDFPANKFPLHLIERNLQKFHAAGEPPLRVFSSDQWSDYLIFRFYPDIRIYFDGRSDFFGPWRGRAYQELMGGRASSAAILDREHIDLALVPRDWPLSVILEQDVRWRITDADERAVLFVRGSVKEEFDSNQKQRFRR
jgi:hypothetical protein